MTNVLRNMLVATICTLCMCSANAYADALPTAVVNGAPTGITSNIKPLISISGNNVVSYKFRLNNAEYSQEYQVDTPLSWDADVTIANNTFKAGSQEILSYINARNTDIVARSPVETGTSFIDAMSFSNVSIDTDVIYLLNPIRFALQHENILNISGMNVDAIDARLKNYAPVGFNLDEIPAFVIKGGLLSLLPNAVERSFRLTVPALQTNVALGVKAATNCTGVYVDGVKLESNGTRQVAINDGTVVTILATFLDGTEIQYIITGAVDPALSLSEARSSYYFVTEDPANDYIIIYNNQNADVSLRVDLNGKMYDSSAQVYNEIAAMPDEVFNEPLHRKVWRYIKNNKYHFPPLTSMSWYDSPALFFNSLGFGWCGDAATLFNYILTALGHTTRYYALNGHAVPEVFVNNRWEMWDPDLEVYYYNSTGEVAGIDELAANPSLITSPVNPILPPESYPYIPEIAEIYKQPLWFLFGDRLLPPIEVTNRFTLPAYGRLEFPYVSGITLSSIYNWYPPKYANAKLVIPRGWSGTINNPLMLHTIGYEGAHTLDVLAKDAAGSWQSAPTTSTWVGDIQPPYSKTILLSGTPETSELLEIASNEPCSTYYTLDGSDPTPSSLLYQSPVTLDAHHVLKFFSIDQAGNASQVWRYPLPVTSVTLSTGMGSTSVPGSKVVFNAAASGGSGSYEYEFRFLNSNSDTWKTGQLYSASSSWTWDTSGLAPGDYTIEVRVKSSGLLIAYGNYARIIHTISPPVSDVTVTMDKPSPQLQGAAVIFTATASGGSGDYSYYFAFYNPNTGTWHAGQAYGGNNCWYWDTAGLAPGSYTIQIWAKNNGSMVSYDASSYFTYTINPPPVSGLVVSMDMPPPQLPGETVTFTASASGGSGSYSYYFTWRDPNAGVWHVGQAYGANNIWTWDTSGLLPGKYSIQVWTKSSGSSVAYDKSWGIIYEIVDAFNVNGEYFNNLHDVYQAAADGSVIRVIEGVWPSTNHSTDFLSAGHDKSVTIEGGYGPAFTSNTNVMSTIRGRVNLKAGKVAVKQIIIRCHDEP